MIQNVGCRATGHRWECDITAGGWFNPTTGILKIKQVCVRCDKSRWVLAAHNHTRCPEEDYR